MLCQLFNLALTTDFWWKKTRFPGCQIVQNLLSSLCSDHQPKLDYVCEEQTQQQRCWGSKTHQIDAGWIEGPRTCPASVRGLCVHVLIELWIDFRKEPKVTSETVD